MYGPLKVILVFLLLCVPDHVRIPASSRKLLVCSRLVSEPQSLSSRVLGVGHLLFLAFSRSEQS